MNDVGDEKKEFVRVINSHIDVADIIIFVTEVSLLSFCARKFGSFVLFQANGAFNKATELDFFREIKQLVCSSFAQFVSIVLFCELVLFRSSGRRAEEGGPFHRIVRGGKQVRRRVARGWQ